MLDTTLHSIPHQRALGHASVGVSLRRGQPALRSLRQSGCAKAFLPRVSGAPEIVFLNTAGGLTGGDTLSFGVTLGAGVRAVATTQTAERAYASTATARAAQVSVGAEVGAGAHLDWLPQETIVFEAARLERETRISLARDASVLFCEALVLGRAAMGETLEALALRDRRLVEREGRAVMIDAVELSTQALARRGARAGLGDARAVATIALVASGAEDAAGALRGVAVPESVRVGVSGWDGRVVVRLMAPDGWPLRLAMAALLRHLRAGDGMAGALPRVWQI